MISIKEPLHIKVDNPSDIAKLVLMPGDPLRAKHIAENFLENSKEVTSVRNMLGFTGFYKGKEVTIMSSGMGIPSMGIYSFELFHFFNVDRIIRIGTCGVVDRNIKVPEIILAKNSYSESSFAYNYNGYVKNVVNASEKLNSIIKETSNELDMKIHEGTIFTCDAFGPYIDIDKCLNRVPKYINILVEEMEGFGLLHVASSFNKDASVILTAVDSRFDNVNLSVEEREKSLDNMIKLALESIIK